MWERLERYEMKYLARRGGAAEPGPPPDPSRPIGTDLLPQIEHIVVLMMENHSYDNYLGMLRGRGEGFPLGADGEPAVSNPGTDGEPVPAHHLPSTVQHLETPSQSWHASHLQWRHGTCRGFVAGNQEVLPDADPAISMGYWTEDDIPFYYGLARTFPLADHWFSSLPGAHVPQPPFPHRGNRARPHRRPAVRPARLPARRDHLRHADQARDLLGQLPRGARGQAHGPALRPSHAPHGPAAAAADGQVAAGRDRRGPVRTCSSPPTSSRSASRGTCCTSASTDEFFADADNGTLPSFCIVDPDFDVYSEENPQDIRKGESFAAEVINRVMHGKGWPRTLLIWVYDEHGGYHDHVPPPAAVPPDDVEGRSLTGTPSRFQRLLRVVLPRQVHTAENETEGPRHYDRYGFRVPAVIVSPYARPDCVLSEVLDHTSVLKLVEEKWNLPTLTARDAAAVSPLGALDLAGPPAFLDPPSLPEPSLKWGTW